MYESPALEPDMPIRVFPDTAEETDGLDVAADPRLVVTTCANCGARMDERTCKHICRRGHFVSCPDHC